MSALDKKNGIGDQLQVFGLLSAVGKQDFLAIPKYKGEIQMKYAQPVMHFDNLGLG